MLINRQNLNDLFIGFHAAFKEGFGMAPTDWEKVALRTQSSSKDGRYAWLGNSRGMRKWLGDRTVESLASHDYTIPNDHYEDSVAVGRDDLEDDQYGVYTPLFAEMGRSLMAHPNELVFGLLKQGFSTLCYDGQYFFDTDHPVENADGSTATVSNSGGGSSTPWFLLDTSRMLRPLILQVRKEGRLVRKDREEDDNTFQRNEYWYGVDSRCGVGFGLWQLAYGSKQALDATAYEAARSALLGLKSRGRPLGIMPNLLVVPPSLEGAARSILTVQLAGNGQSNKWYNSAELLVTPWLA